MIFRFPLLIFLISVSVNLRTSGTAGIFILEKSVSNVASLYPSYAALRQSPRSKSQKYRCGIRGIHIWEHATHQSDLYDSKEHKDCEYSGFFQRSMFSLPQLRGGGDLLGENEDFDDLNEETVGQWFGTGEHSSSEPQHTGSSFFSHGGTLPALLASLFPASFSFLFSPFFPLPIISLNLPLSPFSSHFLFFIPFHPSPLPVLAYFFFSLSSFLFPIPSFHPPSFVSDLTYNLHTFHLGFPFHLFSLYIS